MNQPSRFTRSIKKITKLLLSNFYSNWSLHNYPIEYRKQEIIDLSNTNLTMFPWEARIIGWYWMNGDGFTKQEALSNLKDKFNDYKLSGKSLPRPGRKVKVTFMSVATIQHYDKEAIEFFKIIFDMDYNSMFISDGSSLNDFCWSDESIIETKNKINNTFNINVDIHEGHKIIDILKEIRTSTSLT